MENNVITLKKGFVVDTSALMEHPDIVDRVPGAVFIPLTVIKQLDGLKNNSDINVSKQARSASFFIERAIKEKRVAVLTKFDRVDGLDNESDNRIVGAAVWLQEYNPFAEISLVTTDRNMRIVASGYGLSNSTDREIEHNNFHSGLEIPKWRSVLKWSGIALTLLSFITVFVLLAIPSASLFSADVYAAMVILGFVFCIVGLALIMIGQRYIKGNTHRNDWAGSTINTGGDMTLPIALQDDKGIAWRFFNIGGK